MGKGSASSVQRSADGSGKIVKKDYEFSMGPGCLNLDRFSWRESHGSQNAWARSKSSFQRDSNIRSAGHLNRTLPVRSVGNRPVGFENEDESFLEIRFGLGQGPSLSVNTGDFLHISDIPLPPLHINGCKLGNHGDEKLTEKGWIVNLSH